MYIISIKVQGWLSQPKAGVGEVVNINREMKCGTAKIIEWATYYSLLCGPPPEQCRGRPWEASKWYKYCSAI